MGHGRRYKKSLISLNTAAKLTSVFVAWAAIMLLRPEAGRAEILISIELVLAVDVSRSVDDTEYDLQMTGIATAFRNPEIIDLIGRQDGVAVSLFQWSGDIDEQYLIPWRVLTNPATILAFAAEVENAERNPVRQFTGIGRAIDFGVRLIGENGFAGRRLKIDISGDGRDNIGSLTPDSQRRATARGIVINGLPILIDTFFLDVYYRDNVIAGPGAFIEVADDYDDFSRAFLRKLRREISPLFSRNYYPPRQSAAMRAARLRPVDVPRNIRVTMN